MAADMPQMSWPQQSPIDIRKTYFAPELLPVVFNYPLKITGQIDDPKSEHPNFIVNQACGAILQFEGMDCPLAKIHFHSPSEHKLNGQQYKFEIHLVHTVPAFPDDFSSAYVVVGVLYDPPVTKKTKRSAATNEHSHAFEEFIRQIGLPESNVAKALFSWDLSPEKGDQQSIVPEKFLPPEGKRENHYRYEGSLTTPTYSEFVSWVVLKEIVKLVGSENFKFESETQQHARDCQPINRRFILRNNK
jgi:carbonic anhydrase